jgi:hypothetical protein
MRFGRLLRLCGLFGSLVVGSVAVGQGTTPAPFRSYVVVDQRTDAKDTLNRTGKLHDLVGGNGLNPVVAVFANKVPTTGDEPIAGLVKKLKEMQGGTFKADQLGAFVVFTALDNDYITDEKADATAEAIKAWATTVQPGGVVVALAKKADGKDGDAKNWNLPADGVTVVFIHKTRIVKRWDLKEGELTAEAINAVADEVGKELKKK